MTESIGTNLATLGEKMTFEPTGLAFHGKLSIDEWLGVGEQLLHIEKNRLFWVGDWVNYGETHFGEKYSQALEHTDYTYGTLRNAAYVCSRIPKKARNPKLSFNHHYAVAKMSENQRNQILEIADKEEMTVKEVRQEADKVLGKKPKVDDGKIDFDLWVSRWMFDRWQDKEPKGNITMTIEEFINAMGNSWFAGQVNK